MASRRHAKITFQNFGNKNEPPECFLEDLGSRNNTELNGTPLEGATRLRERDRILVGATLLGFFLRDETEMELDKSLYELATKDTLTGLDNRHQFMAMVSHHVERGRRYGRKVALLIADADHFKAINDTYGHDVGDRALVHLARIIATSCRASELCARWGGEEFTVLLPEGGSEGAATLAERIRRRVQSLPLEFETHTIPMSVSIGGSLLQPEDTQETLFRRTDQNLLRAKELGRNRTVLDDQVIGYDRTATFSSTPPKQSTPAADAEPDPQ
jgi:diguanylate cyclase (GGDEF)-like protein